MFFIFKRNINNSVVRIYDYISYISNFYVSLSLFCKVFIRISILYHFIPSYRSEYLKIQKARYRQQGELLCINQHHIIDACTVCIRVHALATMLMQLLFHGILYLLKIRTTQSLTERMLLLEKTAAGNRPDSIWYSSDDLIWRGTLFRFQPSLVRTVFHHWHYWYHNGLYAGQKGLIRPTERHH